ncbi:hypothetical protein IE337_04665 [Weissella viridescens]|uniref:hypothetical protein n=1 Tax=Weissella viridescens TaxID=1629 RepID=UPI001746E1DE|nr:hypothetical protein [Weissella viridescens]QOD85499.1 hypothetical protein IE337_04665 [Weissella viridescens]WJI90609.1 hypothetical protein PWA48_04655 [Weissella viridescens]
MSEEQNVIQLTEGWVLRVLNGTVTKADVKMVPDSTAVDPDSTAVDIEIYTTGDTTVPAFTLQLNVLADVIEVIGIDPIQKIQKLAIKMPKRIEVTLA